MIVCHCQAVSERRIRAELDRGADSVEDILRSCGAGMDCGSCLPAVDALVTASAPLSRQSVGFVDAAVDGGSVLGRVGIADAT